MIEQEKIAPGHNNVAGLQPLRELDALNGFFRRYRWAIESEWHDWETRIFDSLRHPQPIGRAWVAWVVGVAAQEEYQLLKQFGGNCTIYAYDKGNMLWRYFNAWLILPDIGEDVWDRGYWVGLRLEFRDLNPITGFDTLIDSEDSTLVDASGNDLVDLP